MGKDSSRVFEHQQISSWKRFCFLTPTLMDWSYLWNIAKVNRCRLFVPSMHLSWRYEQNLTTGDEVRQTDPNVWIRADAETDFLWPSPKAVFRSKIATLSATLTALRIQKFISLSTTQIVTDYRLSSKDRYKFNIAWAETHANNTGWLSQTSQLSP